jgi:hypothetical protein
MKIFNRILLFLFIIPNLIFSEMSSNHYFVTRDSVNSFGGENSSSANYVISDSGGQIVSGFNESASYILNSGFRQFEKYNLSASCNTTNINLAPLQISGKSVLDNSYINCIIKTNNPLGYSLKLGSKENELTHSKSPQYKINAIGNSTANF